MSVSVREFRISDVSIRAGGGTYPSVPYELEWTNNRYCRAFYDMYQGAGLSVLDSNGITMAQFKEGSTMFVFNLSPADDDEPFDLVRDGTTSIRVKFRTPVQQRGAYMIAYAESDGMILIDKNYAITTDVRG